MSVMFVYVCNCIMIRECDKYKTIIRIIYDN